MKFNNFGKRAHGLVDQVIQWVIYYLGLLIAVGVGVVLIVRNYMV